MLNNKLFLAVVTAFFIAASASAVVVDTALWSLHVDPSFGGGPSGLTSAGGNQAVQNNNSNGTIVSDFSFSGDFNFSGVMTATTAAFNDNDLMGLVFGWQDESNHYRIGWEQGGQNDSSGASGLFLVREVAGVSTILSQQEVFWQDNVGENFVVGRTGNQISFSIGGVSQSFTDTTFMSGHVGFWTASQTATFSGLASDPTPPPPAVPEPATVSILALGFACLALVRRK